MCDDLFEEWVTHYGLLRKLRYDPVLRESWALWDTTPVTSQQSGSGGVSGVDDLTGPTEAEGRRVWVVEPGMGHIGEYSMSLTLCKDILILPHRGSILSVTVAYIPMTSRLWRSPHLCFQRKL